MRNTIVCTYETDTPCHHKQSTTIRYKAPHTMVCLLRRAVGVVQECSTGTYSKVEHPTSTNPSTNQKEALDKCECEKSVIYVTEMTSLSKIITYTRMIMSSPKRTKQVPSQHKRIILGGTFIVQIHIILLSVGIIYLISSLVLNAVPSGNEDSKVQK